VRLDCRVSEEDRLRWDRKHASVADEPGAPLASIGWLPVSAGGLALDLACGRGRHCEALVRRGYRVVAADISAVALSAVRRRYQGPSIALVRTDFEQWPFAEGVFDAVVQTDFLDRALFPRIQASIRPGGCVLVDTFRDHPARPAGPSNPAYLLRAGELAAVFRGWEVVRHVGAAADSPREALCARKPPR
jgi:SAM-dependent methyltransferase